MAYVTVPKDLTRVKSKVVLGLTKRQLICFGGALLVGVPLFLLIRGRVPTSAAALIMVFAMLPGFLLALYERHGQPLEVVVWQIIQCSFIQPKERPYQTNNAYSALVRHNLACVLPDVLTSPQLTAEWENTLTAIAKGEADPDGFMAGIEEMTRGLISGYSQISEDAQKLFQKERVAIGKCPRCGEAVYEGKKNYYCGNRACQFVMWKNDRFFEERGKAFTPKIAAALLKDGKAKVKGLRSMKTGKTYDGTVLLADTGGKYVNYRIERRDKN